VAWRNKLAQAVGGKVVRFRSDGLVQAPLYLFDSDGWFYSFPDLTVAAGWIEPLTLEESSAWFDALARPVTVTLEGVELLFELADIQPREGDLKSRLTGYLFKRRKRLNLSRSNLEELALADLVSLAASVE
jgi:hypothetical protein